MASSRSINNALIRSLGRCENPVCVLDRERLIRYVNEALLTWLDVDSELTGVRCDYHSGDRSSTLEQAASRLCPPPEVFEGQQMTGLVAGARADGSLVYREARFIPLRGENSCLENVLIVVDTCDCPGADSRQVFQAVPQKTGTPRQSQCGTECHSDPQAAAPDSTTLHWRLQELRSQFASRYSLDRLIGDSIEMRRVRNQVGAAIASQARVVVIGPEGSGREHVARTIFFGPGNQDDSALIPVDCPLMDAELLQATITNLQTQVATSHDVRLGTLLLLGADELNGGAQQELLGFLSLPSVDFTIIATARQSLLELAGQGEFSLDLAHALSTMEIEIPPLSERRDDIPLLCQAALESCNVQADNQLGGFTEEALEQLVAFRWPGNVQQLVDYVIESCASAGGPLVTASDLPKAIRLGLDADELPEKKDEAVVLDDLLADIEAELLRRAMVRAKGNKSKAAELLGISRARLHRRLEQLELTRDDDAAP